MSTSFLLIASLLHCVLTLSSTTTTTSATTTTTPTTTTTTYTTNTTTPTRTTTTMSTTNTTTTTTTYTTNTTTPTTTTTTPTPNTTTTTTTYTTNATTPTQTTTTTSTTNTTTPTTTTTTPTPNTTTTTTTYTTNTTTPTTTTTTPTPNTTTTTTRYTTNTTTPTTTTTTTYTTNTTTPTTTTTTLTPTTTTTSTTNTTTPTTTTTTLTPTTTITSTTNTTTPTTTTTTLTPTTTTTSTTNTTTPTTTTTTSTTTTTAPNTPTTTPSTTATTRTTEASITFDPPVVDSWFPQFGPLAGSTKIVLRGTRLNNTIAGIYFESSHNSAVIENSIYDRLTLFSPSANVTGKVSMTVIALHNSAIVANLSFLYKPNPLIQGFGFAPQLLTTGGSILTVIGENLDSVATPQLKLTVVIDDHRGTTLRANSYFQDCSFNETTQNMTCLLPDLNLGPDFTRKLQKDQESGVNTSTTQPGSVAMLFGPNKTVAFVYLGLVFDGDQMYDNLSDPKSGLDPLYLGFIPPPTINSSKDILTFDPTSEDIIRIEGTFLQQACDYGVRCQVFIGPAPCTILSITYNAITCQPPKEKPHSYPNDTFCTQDHPDTFTIKVVVGFYTYYYRCLQYLYLNIPLIIGLTVGIGTLLLIVIIIVVTCLCVHRKRRQIERSEDHRNLSNTENQELQDNNPILDNSFEVERGLPRNYRGARFRGQTFDAPPGLPVDRFGVGSLANGHDAWEMRNRNSSESAANADYDDTIPGDGSERRIVGQRTSMYPPESPRFRDNVQVGDSYDSRIPYSTDQPGSASLRRETIYPPAFGYLAMVPEQAEVQLVSNRNSLFPPL